VREMRSQVQFWKEYRGITGTGMEWVENTKTRTTDALKESKEYLVYLEKELAKKEEERNQSVAAYQSDRKSLLLKEIPVTRSTIDALEQLQVRIGKTALPGNAPRIDSLVKEAMPLTLLTKLEKARMNSFELMSRIEAKSIETKNSHEHYDRLLREINGVNNRLAAISASSAPGELDRELAVIEKEIVPLTQQTPYTLLMMRVVEIGLPLLLSIFSIFFVMRYSLTEKRSHEIKELIRLRNLELLNKKE
jgi:glycoside/pentoside/hexuronide:cation symporter, GPH family